MNEHSVIDVENFSYEKFIWTLLTLAHLHKVPIERIGQEVCERTGMVYPLYRFIINEDQVKESICLVTGIHGNEIAGPLSILYLLQTFVHLMPGQFRYIVYPLINPTGFDLRQRYDSDGRDLNAIYSVTLKSKNYRENQAFFEDAKKYGPYEAVLTLHEDSDLEKFYMYGLGKKNLDFYHAICAFARMLCPAWVDADVYGCPSDEFGLVLSTARDHAFDGALYHQGLAKVALTLETPGKLDVHFRANMMAQLVLHCLHLLGAMSWMAPYFDNLPHHEHAKSGQAALEQNPAAG